METKIQMLFFQHIKSVLPPHLSLVEEVASILNLSNDSAYRRIRGEKAIDIEELQALAIYFKISIDQFLHLSTNSFLFTGELTTENGYSFEQWLNSIYQQLKIINSFPQKHLYFLAKDLPVMNQFMTQEMLSFKSFLWRKSILHYDDLKGKKFALNDINLQYAETGKKIEALYAQIPSTEIWNLESINSTIRQIEFYREANMFEYKAEIQTLYIALLKTIDHLELQAETGKKFVMGTGPDRASAPYNLLWNDLFLGDNTIFFDMGDKKLAYLNHSVINFIATANERFTNHIFSTIQNISKHSTQLSLVGERERRRFFDHIKKKVTVHAGL